MTTLEDLRAVSRRLVEKNGELEQLNERVRALRAERSMIEDELSNIIRNPTYNTVNELSLPDGHTIKIKRQTKTVPSLSSARLRLYLLEHFGREEDAMECYRFINLRLNRDAKIDDIKLELR